MQSLFECNLLIFKVFNSELGLVKYNDAVKIRESGEEKTINLSSSTLDRIKQDMRQYRLLNADDGMHSSPNSSIRSQQIKKYSSSLSGAIGFLDIKPVKKLSDVHSDKKKTWAFSELSQSSTPSIRPKQY